MNMENMLLYNIHIYCLQHTTYMNAPGLFLALFHCLCADLNVEFPLTSLNWLQIVHCGMRTVCMKQYDSIMFVEMKCCPLFMNVTLSTHHLEDICLEWFS